MPDPAPPPAAAPPGLRRLAFLTFGVAASELKPGAKASVTVPAADRFCQRRNVPNGFDSGAAHPLSAPCNPTATVGVLAHWTALAITQRWGQLPGWLP